MPATTNAEQFDRARKVLVGGVNSAVRAFRAVGGTPRFIARGEGAHVWDVEGRQYIDYLGSWGPLILGHAHPRVNNAVREAIGRGLSFGAPCVQESELAEQICRIFPHVERVRFTSSGTEAAMSVLRLARGFTGRNHIVKFEGCYHGTADSLLVKAGSGALTLGTPSSAGIPAAVVQHTLVASFNDLGSVQRLFEAHGQDIACVIVEPMPGNMNLLLPDEGFLQGVRDLCNRHQSLLVFDEVMSGFRVALAGAQACTGVTPDLSIFGKVIGGGMPVGAIGGQARVMEQFAPLGPVYQAGTLSGNPIAMAAGLATLDLVHKAGFYERLGQTMDRLVDGLNRAAAQAGVPFSAHGVGGLGGITFRASVPRTHAQAQDQDLDAFRRFYHLMMDAGVYLPPSPYEAFFLSSAHSSADIDRTIEAAAQAFHQLR